MNDKENVQQQREKLRQEEIKKNPTGNVSDAFNRANNGSLVDLVGSLGWKGVGVLILVIIFGYIIYSVFIL